MRGSSVIGRKNSLPGMKWASLVATALSLVIVTACKRDSATVAAKTDPDSAWMRLNVDSLPGDSLGVSIRRGQAILAATHDSMPEYAPSALKCTSCHLDNGRRLGAV